ncbi:hypothetical protein HDU86_007562 [Geranomyces michiganensis]|nr:hypothetical protein HDU86_007562 [Geranomyces michiganensis]
MSVLAACTNVQTRFSKPRRMDIVGSYTPVINDTLGLFTVGTFESNAMYGVPLIGYEYESMTYIEDGDFIIMYSKDDASVNGRFKNECIADISIFNIERIKHTFRLAKNTIADTQHRIFYGIHMSTMSKIPDEVTYNLGTESVVGSVPVMGNLIKIFMIESLDARSSDGSSVFTYNGYLLTSEDSIYDRYYGEGFEYIHTCNTLSKIYINPIQDFMAADATLEVELRFKVKRDASIFNRYDSPNTKRYTVEIFRQSNRYPNLKIRRITSDTGVVTLQRKVTNNLHRLLFDNNVTVARAFECTIDPDSPSGDLTSCALEKTRRIIRKSIDRDGYTVDLSLVDGTKVELEIELIKEPNLVTLCRDLRHFIHSYTCYSPKITIFKEKFIDSYIKSGTANPRSIFNHVMPIPLDVRYYRNIGPEDFCTPKYDGERMYLFCYNRSLIQYSRLKQYEVVQSNLPVTFDYVFIVDCELYDKKYYVFDCMNFMGTDIRMLGYSDRLKRVDSICDYMCSQAKAENTRLMIIKKPMYNVTLDTIVELTSLKFSIPIDGIIFYRKDQLFDDQPVKWKSTNTVDLKYTTDGSIDSLSYEANNNASLIRMDLISIRWHDSVHRSSSLIGSIVECKVENRIATVLRVRDDKVTPNKEIVVLAALDDYSNDLTSTESITFRNIKLMAKFHNNMKYTLLAQANKIHGTIVDVGSGHGQDIDRWSRLSNDIQYIICIEKDPSECTRLRSNLEKDNILRAISSVIEKSIEDVCDDDNMIITHDRLDFIVGFFVINQTGVAPFFGFVERMIESYKFVKKSTLLLTFMDYSRIREVFMNSSCNIPHVTTSQVGSTWYVKSPAYTMEINTESLLVNITLVGSKFQDYNSTEYLVTKEDISIQLTNLRFQDSQIKHFDMSSSANNGQYYLFPGYIKALSSCYAFVRAVM